MDPSSLLPVILGLAVLLPLASFAVIVTAANKLGPAAAWVATSAIVGACVLSFFSLFGVWLPQHWPATAHHAAHPVDAADPHADHAEPHAEGEHATADKHAGEKHAGDAHAADAHAAAAHAHGDAHAAEPPPAYTGEYYLLGQFGKLRLTISYYIDSLTLCMFCMVTLIASCIHCYAIGYMHDELHPVTDHEVHLADGRELHRPGRFPRFFQYLSLFCFSMLGLVLSGNIAMVFVFWELVGICSYFLIGFYIERKSASTAANKAFIVNRVGDFGFIIGLMALWTGLGTFAFGDVDADKDGQIAVAERGLFSLVRSPENDYQIETPDGLVRLDAREHLQTVYREHAHLEDGLLAARSEIASQTELWREQGFGYWMLVVGGVGVFCGCVGKSAQFPLHVWLPDAMEGPTPVSALVHSATMVAAGVYLVGRFYPVFTPEVLLVIAVVGCITLFLAATIAITATDIKRVLAYSTVSQLGYMMLALGVGGWAAGLSHLVTHAFFKSLLFMCSGSVIHAVHTNDMRRMGGLLKKMPVTAITMLVGCLAIAGVGVPFVIGLSGYYSKDTILEQAFSFAKQNSSPLAGVFFYAAAGGAAVTAFYMFRMWCLTFVGQPRDQERYDHAHESPPVMFWPLVVLAVFAVSVAWTAPLVGFGVVPAAYLIYLGVQHGWFRKAPAGHGHDAHGHGHDDHGHHAHGHDAHSQDAHGHDAHGHEPHGHAAGGPSLPQVSYGTLAVLLVATVLVGIVLQPLIPDHGLSLVNLLEQSRPAGTLATTTGQWTAWVWPNEHESHALSIVVPVTLLATGTWILGIGLATAMYGLRYLNPEDARRQFSPVYTLLVNKWWFDELYDALFVQPTHVVSRFTAGIDRRWIDGFIDGLGRCTVIFARWWDLIADRTLVDGLINLFAGWMYSLGLTLRHAQTGRLRQYVLFIVIGAIALFVLISLFWSPTLAR